MYKLIVLVIISLFGAMKVAAQGPPIQTSKDLLLAIKKSKPDTNRISLELKLGNSYLLYLYEKKSDERIRRLDSAISVFNQAVELSIKLHEPEWQYTALGSIAFYYEVALDPKHCEQTYRRIIAYYHQTGNLSKEARTWEKLAQMVDNRNENVRLQAAIPYYQHSRLLYLQNHQPIEAAGILAEIASWRTVIKQLDLAERELQQALAEYKAAGYKQLQFPYMTLAGLEYQKGNYYRAIAYCLQGIECMKTGEHRSYFGYFYATAARCNFAVKKYNDALSWIRKTIAIQRDNTEYKFILVETLLALNRTKEAHAALNSLSKIKPHMFSFDTLYIYRASALYYAKINNDELAVQYYLKSLEIISRSRGAGQFYNIWYVICNNKIANIYLKLNQPAKAKKYIDNAALTFKTAKTPLDYEFLVDFYDNFYKYDVATGNYKAAVKNLEHRVKIQDSLFTADKDQQLAELNITYETVQKEQSIRNLHSQGAAQQARLEKANLQRNITIAGIGVMILVSALFYRNYRQKQTANNIITHKNELLQHLLTEKEWLLKEVHHRVKNNLHTVICLLESQAAYLKDDALKAIENGQHRIYAMSLIHQKLYQSDDVKTIDMASYIPDLMKSLEDSFDVSGQIQFKLNIDPINLNISHAIPIGLIINEAVTNSIKYAFPNNRKGEISISMVTDSGGIKLELADNGIGMPGIANETESGSLGIILMKGLSEDIDAEISFEVSNGTRIIIVFNAGQLNDGDTLSTGAIKKEVYV